MLVAEGIFKVLPPRKEVMAGSAHCPAAGLGGRSYLRGQFRHRLGAVSVYVTDGLAPLCLRHFGVESGLARPPSVREGDGIEEDAGGKFLGDRRGQQIIRATRSLRFRVALLDLGVKTIRQLPGQC